MKLVRGANNLFNPEGIEVLSISNVEAGSLKLLAAAGGMYLITFAALYFLHKTYKTVGAFRMLQLLQSRRLTCVQYLELRKAYLTSVTSHSFAVLVRDIPSACRTHQDLATFFR